MEDSDSKKHPIWDVYDQYRTARLNVRCYEAQLRWVERKNKWMEIFIAVSTSSTAASLFIFQDYELGRNLLKFFSVAAVLLSLMKPYLKYQDEIKTTIELIAEYKALDYAYQKLVISIKQRGKYDDEMKNKFLELIDKAGKIVDDFTAGPIAHKIRNRVFEEVNKELPSEKFYVPEV
ncbi:MAG: hypothetical protein HQK96_16965 [Nitrospirae bacterium]|nr:hypothetical protein [Nitrospirota bacterium]